MCSFVYPIKGTDYYQDIEPSVVPLADWENGSDRDFQIRGRHSRRYYQFADQLLKSEVALDRLQRSVTSSMQSHEIALLQQSIGEARTGLQFSSAEVEI